mmetsp:Transcript_43638/g.98661  ORF Transcript_43638/g.98661 Transcript_43638/m.98661 type:complete len:322 (+) Transcript_43638:932-1897(+)
MFEVADALVGSLEVFEVGVLERVLDKLEPSVEHRPQVVDCVLALLATLLLERLQLAHRLVLFVLFLLFNHAVNRRELEHLVPVARRRIVALVVELVDQNLEVGLELTLDQQKPLVLQADQTLQVVHVRHRRRRVLIGGEVEIVQKPRDDAVLALDCLLVQRRQYRQKLLELRKLRVAHHLPVGSEDFHHVFIRQPLLELCPLPLRIEHVARNLPFFSLLLEPPQLGGEVGVRVLFLGPALYHLAALGPTPKSRQYLEGCARKHAKGSEIQRGPRTQDLARIVQRKWLGLVLSSPPPAPYMYVRPSVRNRLEKRIDGLLIRW